MDILFQLIANGLIAGAIYALLAVSFNFIFSTTKFFNLAHGSVAVLAAYTVYLFSKQFGWPVWIGIVLGVVAAAALGFLMNLLVFAPLRKRKASPMILLVASLGLMIMIASALAIFFTSNFRTIAPQALGRSFEVAGVHFSLLHIVVFLTGIAVSSLLFFLFEKTLFGKAVHAVSNDAEVAEIVGINTNRVIAQVFVLGSAVAGLGGILFAFDTGIAPTSDLDMLLKAVISAIIGGVGNIYGALLGAFLIGLVENVSLFVIPAQWKDAIAFGLLMIFLILRPGGIIRK